MIKGLTYAVVTTRDMPRARKFFTEKLGLGTEDDMGDTFSQFATGPAGHRPKGEGTLWGVMQRPDDGTAGDVMLYLLVESADEAYRAWKERGVEMVTEPHDEPFGRTFAFKDADGRVLHAYAAA